MDANSETPRSIEDPDAARKFPFGLGRDYYGETVQGNLGRYCLDASSVRFDSMQICEGFIHVRDVFSNSGICNSGYLF